MQRVDVVELEAVARDIARRVRGETGCARRKNVRIQIADAREVLLATRNRYDIIFGAVQSISGGIASLFTTEFYEAAAARLHERHLPASGAGVRHRLGTLRTIYRTITAVFPNVQTDLTSTETSSWSLTPVQSI